MQPFKFALGSFLASALAVCAVKNITVDDFDPRIVYTPSSAWTHQKSGNTFDRFNLTTSYIYDLGSASIKFNGTAVYFMSYGLPLPNPDRYQVTLDGQTETRSLRVSNEHEMAQFMAYAQTSLDASTEHQITISNTFKVPLNIDAFIITVPNDSTDSNGGSQSPEQTQSQSNGDSGLTTAAKAGIAVAVIGGIFLGLLAAFGIPYWRKKKKPIARGDTSALFDDIEGGGSALETHQSLVVSPFVETAGDVQTQPREIRKERERRPKGETYQATETASEIDARATTTSGATSPRMAQRSPSVISASPPPYVS